MWLVWNLEQPLCAQLLWRAHEELCLPQNAAPKKFTGRWVLPDTFMGSSSTTQCLSRIL